MNTKIKTEVTLSSWQYDKKVNGYIIPERMIRDGDVFRATERKVINEPEVMVKLTYSNGEFFYVNKTKFNQAFGAIINANLEDARRDFAVVLFGDMQGPDITLIDWSVEKDVRAYIAPERPYIDGKNYRMIERKVVETPEQIVKLTYSNGEFFYVSKVDFDRAFGAILGAKIDEVRRDFGIILI